MDPTTQIIVEAMIKRVAAQLRMRDYSPVVIELDDERDMIKLDLDQAEIEFGGPAHWAIFVSDLNPFWFVQLVCQNGASGEAIALMSFRATHVSNGEDIADAALRVMRVSAARDAVASLQSKDIRAFCNHPGFIDLPLKDEGWALTHEVKAIQGLHAATTAMAFLKRVQSQGIKRA